MLHKAQSFKRTIKIGFVARQQREVDVIPRVLKIGGFGGGCQIDKEQSGFGMIAPIAVRKLVSNAQTVKNSSKGICVFSAQTGFHVDPPRQGIGRLEATSGCPNPVESGENRISQTSRLTGIKAQSNFQFAEGGEQMAYDAAF
jgi:hypothetical protein